MKKFLALGLAAVLLLSLLSGCTAPAEPQDSADPSVTDEPAGNEPVEDEPEAAAGGSVYYLNFKPEQDAQWQELAALYTEETGVPVKVVTAASGTYETMLTSEMAKEEAPTLFQVNGPVGLNNWKDLLLRPLRQRLLRRADQRGLRPQGRRRGARRGLRH